MYDKELTIEKAWEIIEENVPNSFGLYLEPLNCPNLAHNWH